MSPVLRSASRLPASRQPRPPSSEPPSAINNHFTTCLRLETQRHREERRDPFTLCLFASIRDVYLWYNQRYAEVRMCCSGRRTMSDQRQLEDLDRAGSAIYDSKLKEIVDPQFDVQF